MNTPYSPCAIEMYLDGRKKELSPKTFEVLEYNVRGMYEYLATKSPKKYISNIDMYANAIIIVANLIDTNGIVEKIKNFEQFYTTFYKYGVENVNRLKSIADKCECIIDIEPEIREGFLKLIENAFKN